jgi:hypothetical protein
MERGTGSRGRSEGRGDQKKLTLHSKTKIKNE